MTNQDLKREVDERMAEANKEGYKALDFSNLGITTEQMNNLILGDSKVTSEGLMAFKPESLDLSGNDMQELPITIGMLDSLEDLSVSDNSLKELPQSIALFTNLKELISENNPITSIPEAVSEMTSLEVLYMPNSQLEKLPDQIAQLPNLKEINVAGSNITELPEALGEMPSLSELSVQNNLLETLPESLGNSESIQTINVSQNELVSIPDSFRNLTNLESFNLLQNDSLVLEAGNPLLTFDEGVVLFEHPAFEPGYDETVVLQEMYGENAEAVESQIQNLDPSITYPLGNSDLPPAPASEVIETFLKQIPSFDEFDREFYVPAGKELIDNALDQNSTLEERNTAISNIASSLGNCPTPVKSLLLQTAIGMNANAEGELPEQLKTAIEREAFEEKIVAKLGDELRDNEKIEQVQALVNSVFLENAEQRSSNIVKIAGDRARIPSKTSNIEFGFKQITPEAAQSFAALCCITDTNDKPLQTNDKYTLDPVKYKEITEPYLAKIGVVSEVENLVGKFESEMQNLLLDNMDLLTDHMNNNDVNALLNTTQQKNDLRKELYKAPKEGLPKVYDTFLAQKKSEMKTVSEKYTLAEAKPEQILLQSIENTLNLNMFKVAQPTKMADTKGNTGILKKNSVGKGSTQKRESTKKSGKTL
ncbi:leucine-rich repeat domain-containing protein [Ascidiimonas sp. W6]|uniref:leucine-rich repeat domain-containing protein n=1 Tax=Ascidiimonas meishanensis TaxID=3128903 RepID=UPI0030EBE748